MYEPIVSARIRVPPPNGLRRTRVSALVEGSWQVPLTVVVAPAGSGKTTTLAIMAQTEKGRGRAVAWYQAGVSEADPVRFLNYLEASVRQVVPLVPTGWDSVDKAAAALEAVPLPPLLIVVDDAHTILSTAAEAALQQLVAYLPSEAHLVLAGRHPPAFDLARWRLARQVAEIGPDDLRFRSWEVEELFAQHYGARLVPEEVAELARRTGGWAAGLSLFHLATANRSASERRRVLRSMSSRLLDIRDYLTHNVLATLEEDQQEFLVRTCVLGRLAGPWCDQLMNTSGSARRLEDLARRHPFLVSHDGGNTYQEHEVLRSFLEELLLDQVGEQGTRALYGEAGSILEMGGALSEALRAYCRAQDWGAAERLLGVSGDRVVDPLGPWGDVLPPAVADNDAWYLLAMARRQVRSGRWDGALETYRRAEEIATGALVRRTCERERFQLVGWMDPSATVPHDWTAVLRRALARNPLAALEGADTQSAGGQLACGLAAMAAGHMARAHAMFAAEGDDVSLTSVLRRWADAGLLLTARFSGLPYSAAAFHSCLNDIDPHLPPWLGRLLHALAGRPAGLLEHLEASRGEVMATENPWAYLVYGLLEGCFLIASGGGREAVATFDLLATTAISLGAPVVAAWASAAASLGTLPADRHDAQGRAVRSDQLARSVGCPGASALSLLVEAAARGDSNWREAAVALELEGVVPMANLVAQLHTSSPEGPAPAKEPVATQTGGPVGSAVTPTAVAPGAVPGRPGLGGTDVRCLGPFSLHVSGHAVDGSVARPRVRALLHYLAMQAGAYVHRDVLCTALWPNEEPRPATRGLQVAVSALRQLIDAQAGTGAATIVGRKGESYGLEVDPGANDVARFEFNLTKGRFARLNEQNNEAVADLQAAVALYRGDLLEEAGAAEWVLGPRERYRLMASEASQLLGACLLDLGEPAEAAAVAAWGLGIDRYCDGLWKLLIAAHDRGSNQAASARTRDDYRRVLAALGVGQDVP
jgi:DNA-binding SARP family transcriptional activator